MNKYPDYISEKRRPVESPSRIVDENGQNIFGTFKDPIVDMNFLDSKKPCGRLLPHFMNKVRYTKWEALEIMLDEGILLTAVYHMGLLGFSIFVYYDKNEKKTYSWMNFSTAKKNYCSSKSY